MVRVKVPLEDDPNCTGVNVVPLTDVIAKVGATPVPTWNLYWPEEAPRGLMTSTDHVEGIDVKFGLRIIWVFVCDVMGRLAKVCPAPRSRSVTVHPVVKLEPLIVNGCAPFCAGTGFGFTLVTVGKTMLLEEP